MRALRLAARPVSRWSPSPRRWPSCGGCAAATARTSPSTCGCTARLCPFYDRKWEKINGHVPVTAANPTNAFGFGFYRTADDRWVMPLNPYPKIKVAAQKLLDVPDDPERVAQAVSKWDARELEAAAVEAGVVLPMLRSTEEFLAENTGIENLPLIEITKIGDSEPETAARRRRAAVGRDPRARHGARDRRRRGRPGARAARRRRAESVAGQRVGARRHVHHGQRRHPLGDHRSPRGPRAGQRPAGRRDVFYANRRPGYLEQIGVSAEQAAQVRPGIVHVTASLNGERGPWAGRVGFDQTAGSLVGMRTWRATPPARRCRLSSSSTTTSCRG
ncbi:CoA transferase [Kutzneria kofuensis]|uniref:CoA transferase n=1 Tax=Kutzneria kofuensis TaxID=103725 RepID=UPI0031EF94A2